MDTRDVLARADNEPWVFYAPQVRSAPDGSIVTTQPRTLQPLNGVLVIELIPGRVNAVNQGVTYELDVPDSDVEVDLAELMGVAS
ncbi:hypothetical protein [Mycolicibacterium neoaurum]|uniref:hypothetical protein n=1 Tax=Mycolicibacterium neoaurum TaxID=1795 RepID=UPI00114D4A3C|nr:hypothetical protein [Mycolicibacterium neoaurum]